MKIVTVSDTPLVANMVRGAFQSMNITGPEFIHATDEASIAAALKGDGETVVLVDWEGEPETGAKMVQAAKAAKESAPVLLLCPKSKAGTVFAGQSAGAGALVNKPIDPADLVKAVAAAVKKPSVNVEFINPFIDATKNVFATMCKVEVTRKKLFLKDDYKMMGDVSGVMGLSGVATGTVVVSMPTVFACLVVGNMFGEPPKTELTAEVADAVGEIINMISGQAKAALVKTKYHFTISLPSVVSGSGHEIMHKKGTPNIVVLFDGAGHEFSVQVCLAPTAP